METTLPQPALAPRVKAARIEPEDFDAIVRSHQRRIYGVLLALVRDADAADTLTQECFLRAFRNHRSFRGDALLGTWLVRIAVNLARDHAKNRRRAFWRRLIREDGARAAVADPQPSPERQAAAREELASVWTIVDSLAAQQRTAFLLRYADEMPLEEIACVMEVEVGTVKSHLARAVSAVRQRLRR